MTDRIISAELRIGGQDAGASKMLAEVAANIKKVDEAAAHSAEVSKLGKQMAELKTQMEAVGQLKAAQTNLAVFQERAATTAVVTQKLKTEMAAVATPTAAMAKALTAAETASLKANAAMLKQAESVERNRKALAEMGVSTANAVQEQARLARAFQDTAHAAEIGMRAEQKAATAAAKLAKESHAAGGRGGHGGHGGGFDVGGAVAGALAAHSFISATEGVLEVYREFDKERRYGKVVMGITDEQQKPLVEQAIHGGATSKFNDIQWLESQRELAMRGYNKDQVLGFTPIVAQIGQAFDVSMPEAVKGLEGAMLGFGKDVSTFEKAQAAATRTADLEVKASKISGMTFEDVVALYKYGAAPAKMAHLSEESMLAYGAISKKSNMGGDESGTAFRALVKNLLSPTAEARTAMLANGIDFSKYQAAPKNIDLNAFGRDVAMKYGVRLNAGTREGLTKVFQDKALISDPARFAIAVTDLLKGSLGKQDAKSLKSIAGDAGNFRNDSVGAVDTNGLMAAIMEGIHKSPQMANAIFGSKQGGRIFAALGDPEFYRHILGELQNESQGFGKKVSEDRMAGFDGAVSRFEGAVMNLKSAFGRAFDDDGKGGFLTAATSEAAHFTQALAELDPKILMLGASVTGVVSMWGAAKLAGLFTGATALKGSAVALDEAAAHLMMVNGGGGPGGGAVNEAEKDAGGFLGQVKNALPMLATAGAVAGAGVFVADAMLNHRDHDKAMIEGGHPDVLPSDNNLGLPGVGEDSPSNPSEATKRAADMAHDAAGAAEGAWGYVKAFGKAIGWGDRLHADTPGMPLPPERPTGYSGHGKDGNALHRWDEMPAGKLAVALPALVPPPVVATSPVFHPDDDRASRARATDADAWIQQQDIMRAASQQMGALNDKTGIVLTSFDGLGAGGGTLAGQFTTLGAGSTTLGSALDILTQTAIGAARTLAMVAMSGGAGGGNGVINASWGGRGGSGGGWNGGALPVGGGFGGGSWAKSGASKPEVAAYIRHAFAAQGIDPETALRVSQSEGFNTYTGDYGTSFGPFQLHYGGSGIRGMNSGGLGDRFTRETGKNARDPTTWKAQIDYAAKVARQEGWGAWHGARHVGIGNRQGIGTYHGAVPPIEEHPALKAPPLSSRRPPADHEGPGGSGVTAKLDRVTASLERVASTVERGGLHRVHVALDKGLSGKKGYQRGAMGVTLA